MLNPPPIRRHHHHHPRWNRMERNWDFLPFSSVELNLSQTAPPVSSEEDVMIYIRIDPIWPTSRTLCCCSESEHSPSICHHPPTQPHPQPMSMPDRRKRESCRRVQSWGWGGFKDSNYNTISIHWNASWWSVGQWLGVGGVVRWLACSSVLWGCGQVPS